jgi:hypothetical protein
VCLQVSSTEPCPRVARRCRQPSPRRRPSAPPLPRMSLSTTRSPQTTRRTSARPTRRTMPASGSGMLQVERVCLNRAVHTLAQATVIDSSISSLAVPEHTDSAASCIRMLVSCFVLAVGQSLEEPAQTETATPKNSCSVRSTGRPPRSLGSSNLCSALTSRPGRMGLARAAWALTIELGPSCL